MTKVTRSELSAHEAGEVAAAQLRRESSLYIMLIEILPNCRGPLITGFCLRLGYTTITIGILGFLGRGLLPPDLHWGGMVQQATTMIMAWPHIALLPCLAIVSLLLGVNLRADGFCEIFLGD